LLLTGRAPVAMNDVFGDHRLDDRNVFGVAGARLRAAVERSATIGTLLGPMFLANIDPLGSRTPHTGMARLSSRLLLAGGNGRFGKRRLHAGGRGRSLMRRSSRRGLLPSDHLGLGQERPDHGL